MLALALGCAPDPAHRHDHDSTDVVALSGVSARLVDGFGSLVDVSWTQDRAAAVHVEYTFADGAWSSSPTRSLAAGAHHDLLLGIPYDEVATWRVVAVDGAGTVASPLGVTVTAPLPADVPVATVLAADPARYDAAPYVLLSLAVRLPLPWYALIVDRAGRVVWAWKAPPQRTLMHGRVARDGRSLYLDRNSYWGQFDEGAASTVDQVLLDGTVLHTFATPGLHHPFTDLPDGSLAYGAVSDDPDDEALVVVGRDGTSETVWSCGPWLAAIGETGPCMSNTLNYDADQDRFLFSFFTLESVVEIDAATGVEDAWFGHVAGSYAFDPPDAAFWYQHGGYYTDAGTFLTSSDLVDGAPSGGVETVAREYAVDREARTLREVWSFGVGQGVYGHQLGEAQRLPNGDTLANYGVLARLREATSDQDVVWDVEWPGQTIGHSTPIFDLYALAPAAE